MNASQHAMQVTTYGTAEKAALALAEEMTRYVSEATVPVLLLLSGGSALSVVRRLGTWDAMCSLTIAVLDERFDPTNRESNWAKIVQTGWFSLATAKGAAHIDTLTLVNDTIDTLTARFEEGIAAWGKEHPSGVIVGLFGMGDDGHTAGVFPMPEDLEAFADSFQSERLVLGYRAPDTVTIPLRMTVTLTGIRTFACGFAYVCGGQKRDNLCDLRCGVSRPLHILPAGIWRDLPSMRIATDIVC
jgi:6-phosphogluconolactonase/glucosamine-6-phosphate isomerase/deaminase